MGWKASSIIIQNSSTNDELKLLNTLGFSNLISIDDSSFDSAIYPDDNEVYIGNYRGHIIISAQDYPLEFLESTKSDLEIKLNKLFPNSEICAILLQSVVNFWGYSISKNGERIRVRAGSDEGTYLEIGSPIEEELDLLSKSTIDEEGQRLYKFEEFEDELLTEDQVGENFVFAICKRYFAVELDQDDEIFALKMKGFSFSSDEEVEETKVDEKEVLITNNNLLISSKPWWKFW